METFDTRTVLKRLNEREGALVGLCACSYDQEQQVFMLLVKVVDPGNTDFVVGSFRVWDARDCIDFSIDERSNEKPRPEPR